jgi:hypothetical protein
MRKIIVLVMLVVLSGCDVLYDANYSLRLSFKSLYYDDYSEIEDVYDIIYWIRERVSYQADIDYRPLASIVSSGHGDCDDMSLLFMNIAYIALDMKCDIILVDSSRLIVNGGEVDHTIVRLPDGRFVDVANNKVRSVAYIGYEYKFDEVFYIRY